MSACSEKSLEYETRPCMTMEEWNIIVSLSDCVGDWADEAKDSVTKKLHYYPWLSAVYSPFVDSVTRIVKNKGLFSVPEVLKGIHEWPIAATRMKKMQIISDLDLEYSSKIISAWAEKHKEKIHRLLHHNCSSKQWTPTFFCILTALKAVLSVACETEQTDLPELSAKLALHQKFLLDHCHRPAKLFSF